MSAAAGSVPPQHAAAAGPRAAAAAAAAEPQRSRSAAPMSQPGPPPHWAASPGSPPRRNRSAKCYPPASAGPSGPGSAPPPAAGGSSAPVFVYETSWIVSPGRAGHAAGPPPAAGQNAAMAAARWDSEGPGAAAAGSSVAHGGGLPELRFAHASRAAVPSFAAAAAATTVGGRLGDDRDKSTWERGSEPPPAATREWRGPVSSVGGEFWGGSGGAEAASVSRGEAEWKMSDGGGRRAGDSERTFEDIQQDPAFFSSFEDLQASGYRADDNQLAVPSKSGPNIPFSLFSPQSCAVVPAGNAVSLLSIDREQDRQKISGSSQADVIFTSSPSSPGTLLFVSPTTTNVSHATNSGTEPIMSQDKISGPAGAGPLISSDRGQSEPANSNFERFDSVPYAESLMVVAESASPMVLLPENSKPQIMESCFTEVERKLESIAALEGACLSVMHSEQILDSTDQEAMLVNDTRNKKLPNDACQVEAQDESRADSTVQNISEHADYLISIESNRQIKTVGNPSSFCSTIVMAENAEQHESGKHLNAVVVDSRINSQCNNSLEHHIGSEGMPVISEEVRVISEDLSAISLQLPPSEERLVMTEETPVISVEMPATADEVLLISSKILGPSGEMLVVSNSMLQNPNQVSLHHDNGLSLHDNILSEPTSEQNVSKTNALTPRMSMEGSTYANVGLGLMLEQDLGTLATKVIGVVEGFAADNTGRISIGDVIKAINGEDVTQLPLLEIKRRMLGPVGTACVCVFGRGYISHHIGLVRCSRGSGTKETWINAPSFQANASDNVGISPRRSAEQGQCFREQGGTVGLGMRLEIDCSSLPSGAIVREITKGSAAHNSGKIIIGDVLECIDGISLLGLSLHRIRDLAMGAPGTLCDVRLRRRGTAFDVTLSRIGP